MTSRELFEEELKVRDWDQVRILVQLASVRMDFEFFKWVCSRLRDVENRSYFFKPALVSACVLGRLDLVVLLHQGYGVALVPGCWGALETDKPSVAEYLHRNRCPMKLHVLLQAARLNNHAQIVWLIQGGYLEDSRTCLCVFRATSCPRIKTLVYRYHDMLFPRVHHRWH